MRDVMKLLVAGAGLAALAGAAPAAAQYYPGYGTPYGGYGYTPGVNSQVAINQCASAAQQRLGYNGYGYGGGRVLGISRVEPRPYGFTVRGVATSGRYNAYAYGQQTPVDLTWRCNVDYRGFVTGVSINAAQPNYGYGNYTPWNYDVSRFGYSRY